MLSKVCFLIGSIEHSTDESLLSTEEWLSEHKIKSNYKHFLVVIKYYLYMEFHYFC